MQQHTLFPIKFMYNGVGFETKALKYAYNRDTLYKIALPSAVSPVQQCWISKNADEWKLVMGTAAGQSLMLELITAIKTQEQIVAVMPKTDALSNQPVVKHAALKSA